MSIRLIAFSRLVIIMGLALWMTIAVINNLTDPGTNRLLLGHTLSMGLLTEEEILGAGLRWRAMPANLSPALLYLVLSAQILVCVCLWRASVTYIQAFMRNDCTLLIEARNRALFALSLFVLLWIWFICGGMWFGYWLKQGAVQMVHLSLIVIGLCGSTFVQGQPAARTSARIDSEGSTHTTTALPTLPSKPLTKGIINLDVSHLSHQRIDMNGLGEKERFS